MVLTQQLQRSTAPQVVRTPVHLIAGPVIRRTCWRGPAGCFFAWLPGLAIISCLFLPAGWLLPGFPHHGGIFMNFPKKPWGRKWVTSELSHPGKPCTAVPRKPSPAQMNHESKVIAKRLRFLFGSSPTWEMRCNSMITFHVFHSSWTLILGGSSFYIVHPPI